AVKPVMNATEMLSKTARMVEEARNKGATIMHSPITFKPGYNEISDHPYGILKGVVDANAFVKGEWGAELTEAIPIAENDIVIEGKRGLDAFASTNLDFILRNKGIKNVVLAGFLTNCCVESTMRTAYEHGFNVVTVTDCCAAVSPEQHKAAIEFDFPMFSHPMTQGELLEAIA
ncbi:MAG: cysteine hydrolase, partial [Myxococcota bacterium]